MMSPKLITWDWTFHAGISPWKSPLLFLSDAIDYYSSLSMGRSMWNVLCPHCHVI